MRQKFERIELETSGQRLHEITSSVLDCLERAQISDGLLNLSILHTSASLLIQENASPDVLSDLLRFFDQLVPMDNSLYEHAQEGRDDMPAHIKTALTCTHLSLSVKGGQLVLGTWQGIFLFEHRLAQRHREVLVHLIGS